MILQSPPQEEYAPYRCQCPATKPIKCPACQAWDRAKKTRHVPRPSYQNRNYHKPHGLYPTTSIEHLKPAHDTIAQAIQEGVTYTALARQYHIGPHPFIKYCKATGIYQQRNCPLHPLHGSEDMLT